METRQSLVTIPVALGDRPAGRALTDGYTGDLHPAIDPRGTRLVFSSSRSGSRNLWISKPDGSDARPLTSETAFDERPAFSPDGNRVAFLSDCGGERGIWVMSADGGTPRRLGHANGLDTLTWSPDGLRIVFLMPGPTLPRLAAISADNGPLNRFRRRLLPTRRHGRRSPTESPTSSRPNQRRPPPVLRRIWRSWMGRHAVAIRTFQNR